MGGGRLIHESNEISKTDILNKGVNIKSTQNTCIKNT